MLLGDCKFESSNALLRVIIGLVHMKKEYGWFSYFYIQSSHITYRKDSLISLASFVIGVEEPFLTN